MESNGSHKPTSLLLVRAWPHGDPPTLAARLTYCLDISRPDLVTITAGGAEDVKRAVARWLHAVEHHVPHGDE